MRRASPESIEQKMVQALYPPPQSCKQAHDTPPRAWYRRRRLKRSRAAASHCGSSSKVRRCISGACGGKSHAPESWVRGSPAAISAAQVAPMQERICTMPIRHLAHRSTSARTKSTDLCFHATGNSCRRQHRPPSQHLRFPAPNLPLADSTAGRDSGKK